MYNRRYFVDRARKQIIIINKSIEHPSSPTKPNIQRVHEYWSYMVIHATSNSLRTPGVEYVLTYFENPGVALPQKVQSWVAQKQMPEYLHRLHLATIEYAKERRHQQQQQQQLHQHLRRDTHNVAGSVRLGLFDLIEMQLIDEPNRFSNSRHRRIRGRTQATSIRRIRRCGSATSDAVTAATWTMTAMMLTMMMTIQTQERPTPIRNVIIEIV